jgi:hypothetical protein
MAQSDPIIRIYHTKHPTPDQLMGFSAPVWPDDYALAASFADPGLPPEEALEMAFRSTQADLPEAGTVQWAHARHRSTSPGDVVVLSDGQAYLCAGTGWDPLELPPPGSGRAWSAACAPRSRRGGPLPPSLTRHELAPSAMVMLDQHETLWGVVFHIPVIPKMHVMWVIRGWGRCFRAGRHSHLRRLK